MTSSPILITEVENPFTPACDQFERVVDQLNDVESQNSTHGAIEALIHREGTELLRRLTQGYFDKRSENEAVKDQVMGADGIARTHRRKACERHLETRFGEVIVKRWGYGGKGLTSTFPLDLELNLPPDKYSHGMRIELAHEVIDRSFDEAVNHLARQGGGCMAKRQAEEVSVKLSQDFDAYYEQPLPLPADHGAMETLLVITADGKGIVMHPDG